MMGFWLIGKLFPSSGQYLALVANNTITVHHCFWNVFTAGVFETSTFVLLVNLFVVDDDRFTREQLSSMLEVCEYAVTTVESGALALKLLHHPGNEVDCVLLDVAMPEMDGLTLLRTIRRSPAPMCHLPVIMMSSDRTRHQVSQYLDRGADAYISKPLSISELSLLWQQILSKRRQVRLQASVEHLETRIHYLETENRQLHQQLESTKKHHFKTVSGLYRALQVLNDENQKLRNSQNGSAPPNSSHTFQTPIDFHINLDSQFFPHEDPLQDRLLLMRSVLGEGQLDVSQSHNPISLLPPSGNLKSILLSTGDAHRMSSLSSILKTPNKGLATLPHASSLNGEARSRFDAMVTVGSTLSDRVDNRLPECDSSSQGVSLVSQRTTHALFNEPVCRICLTTIPTLEFSQHIEWCKTATYWLLSLARVQAEFEKVQQAFQFFQEDSRQAELYHQAQKILSDAFSSNLSQHLQLALPALEQLSNEFSKATGFASEFIETQSRSFLRLLKLMEDLVSEKILIVDELSRFQSQCPTYRRPLFDFSPSLDFADSFQLPRVRLDAAVDTTTQQSQLSAIPKIIELASFAVVKLIKSGAYSWVFLVCNNATGDYFACKVMRLPTKSKMLEQLHQERDIMALIESKFIAKLYYSLSSMWNFYLLMEYTPGGDCYSLLQRKGRLPEPQARIYAAELVMALRDLHRRGVAHRDIKPDNILLAADGHIRLTDFGLARLSLFDLSLEPERVDETVHSGLQTETNEIKLRLARRPWRRFSHAGTPEYLAPEVIQRLPYSLTVDWWSLGVTLYELLCGQTPFQGKDTREVYDNILQRRIFWPHFLSKDARDLISSLLNVMPSERLGSGNDGATDVQRHPFFQSIDWDSLHLLPMPKPPIVDPEDISMFCDGIEFDRETVSYQGDNLRNLRIHSTAPACKDNEDASNTSNEDWQRFDPLHPITQPELIPSVHDNFFLHLPNLHELNERSIKEAGSVPV